MDIVGRYMVEELELRVFSLYNKSLLMYIIIMFHMYTCNLKLKK